MKTLRALALVDESLVDQRTQTTIRVLVVDGEMTNCTMFAEAALHFGCEISFRHSLRDCLEAIASDPPDIIFIESNLPDGNSIAQLDKIQGCSSTPTVIVMTARGTSENAESAIRSGAWDYIQKPVSLEETVSRLSRAAEYRSEFQNNRKTTIKRNGIVGNSPAMRASMDMVKQAAESDIDVLISGETGTGKELFALSIHNNSRRADENFVVVDCAALPETLVESILFGHSKGAYTGADQTREGLIRQAHKGTLFLDEIGELPLSLQKTFLRVLQEHRFRPVGCEKEVESDFRLISATNKNLEQMVEEGKFRGDLLYRLRAMTLQLPPLRQHMEDIAEMTEFNVEKVCHRFGISKKKVSDEFLKYLTKYDWPGNVRELFHVIEHACAASLHGETLFPAHLPQELRIHITRSLFDENKPAALKGNNVHYQTDPRQFLGLKHFRHSAYSDLEELYLRNLLSSSSDIKEACMVSKLSRTRLYELLKKYGITFLDGSRISQ